MEYALFYLTILAAIAVFLVLCTGLFTMLRNSGGNLSQTIMRWRVGLQFVAILLIVGYFYMAQ